MNLIEVNQTDRCARFSCPERSVSSVYVLLYVSAAAVVLLTVCGNLLVITSVCHFKQLHTPTNMLILSLAVSDFLVGIFVIPTALIWMIDSCWTFSYNYCVCFILSSYFLTTTSVYNVALIAVDRCLALSNPFVYTERVSLNKMSIVVFINWLLLLIYNITFHYSNMHFVTLCPGECFLVLDAIWAFVDVLFIFVFPCSVIIILYTVVFVIVKKHATSIRELNIQAKAQTSKNMKYSMKSERKAAKVLGILVTIFLSCLLPCSIYSLLGHAIEFKAEILQKVLMMLYLNSTVNPCIYALFYPWFRRSVKLILTLQIFRKDSALIHVL